MSDPFTDAEDELMSRTTDFPSSAPGGPAPMAAASIIGPTATTPQRKQCCPYCGAIINADSASGPCPRCTMEDTPATRAATKSRLGPWYVLQTRNPAAPGMKWTTLLMLVEKGQVTPRSVVRGPTTQQLWRFAAHVKGLSREFGLCYSCGGRVERTTHQCPHCDRLQELPANPDALLETREPVMRETLVLEPKREPMSREPMLQQSFVIEPGRSAMSREPMPREPISREPVSREPIRREIQVPSPSMHAPAPPPPKPQAMDFTLTPRGEREEPGEIGHPPEPDQRTEWHPDPGILSAKELAQAFQLDFTPETRPPRRGRLLRAILTLLVLAIIGFTGLMLLWGDLREQTFAWLNRTSDSIQSYFSRGAKTSTQQSTEPIAAAALPSTQPTAVKPMVHLRATVEGPSTQPSNIGAAPTTIREAPTLRADVEMKTPARQTPPGPQVKPEASSQSSPAVIEDPVDQARALWSHAIDAEAKQDYPEAIKFYEQIKKLPQNVWPAGLEIRLAAAKRQMQ
jgi:hypothetical protein